MPSDRSVGDFKHLKALHQEIAAAKALANVSGDETRVTLHFDTTGRSRLDGEWPSLILNFRNDDKEKCKMYCLRALFFAYEDREQITKLIVETLKRLSVATGGTYSPKDLWENVYSFMTDAVTKNLHVENLVAEALNSAHKPHHVLCKSHTCEKLDEACINALIDVERDTNYSQLIIKRQPQLKSFVRQSKCIALAAVKAMLKLVSHEESGKPTSMAKDFDRQLEEDGIAKSMSLYKERRFAKLGYSAGAILDCIQQYDFFLDKTTYNNLLVQACKLYTESEYIRAAFKALAYFTYRVTMPLLNCVERCDQNMLMVVIKQLYLNLKDYKMDSLDEYNVEWTHVDTDKLKPETPLDTLLLEKMCEEAAKGVHMQCAREYWEECEEPRATQLHKLTEDERKRISTNNLSCERYLSRMGGLASLSAAKSNKFFKAKRIRDDLMFEKYMCAEDEEEAITKATRNIIGKLKLMELIWTDKQKQCWKTKVQDSLRKNTRNTRYKELLLQRCKRHGGPLTSVEELGDLVNNQSDKKNLETLSKKGSRVSKNAAPV